MSRLHMGIDVGSTTVKVVVLDENNNTLFAEYQTIIFQIIKSTVKGHFCRSQGGCQKRTVHCCYNKVLAVFCFQKMLDLPFVQEVIAKQNQL